ncbi:MAG: DegV family protein [Lachnospiraceae bacterium]|nr:DegV family protein [Lachnospiraceae bacterium]
MGKIKLVTDSTCNLSSNLISKYDISILPLSIIMGENVYSDGLDITPEAIYKWSDANKTTPKTDAVTPDKAVDILQPFVEAGRDIIFFGISSQMSTTCNVIRTLSETTGDSRYANIRVIDTLSVSAGINLQILYAVKLAEEGKNADEIVELVNKRREKVNASFLVDTLTYLSRGGRCSAAAALLANTLKVKPRIVIKNGVMDLDRKYRGSAKFAIFRYVEDLKYQLLSADETCVFISHSGCSQEVIDDVWAYLAELHHFHRIYVTRAGSVISSHCGPGTLGIYFYESK